LLSHILFIGETYAHRKYGIKYVLNKKTQQNKNPTTKKTTQNKATIIFLHVFKKQLKSHLIHTVTRMYFNHKGKFFCAEMTLITSEIN